MSAKRSTGGRVLAAREAKGLSLRRAARRLGVSPRALRNWEKGRADIPFAVRQAMVALYGLPRQELIPDRPAGGERASNGMIRIGSVLFHLEGGDDNTLLAFLKAVRKERGLSEGDALAVRASDAEFLAELLGGTPEAIVANLQRLLGLDEKEAIELGRFLFRRTAVAGALVVGLIAGVAVTGAASADPSPAAPAVTSVTSDDAPVDPWWAEIGDAAVLYRDDVPGAGQN
ncbi:MAG TPA: helix-turn-helix transcriptional regulator [Acidimicrobiia bacterium]|nr:helix-turn-helix transcriptional regulator [Acidimicrobiia bacterium]